MGAVSTALTVSHSVQSRWRHTAGVDTIYVFSIQPSNLALSVAGIADFYFPNKKKSQNESILTMVLLNFSSSKWTYRTFLTAFSEGVAVGGVSSSSSEGRDLSEVRFFV